MPGCARIRVSVFGHCSDAPRAIEQRFQQGEIPGSEDACRIGWQREQDADHHERVSDGAPLSSDDLPRCHSACNIDPRIASPEDVTFA